MPGRPKKKRWMDGCLHGRAFRISPYDNPSSHRSLFTVHHVALSFPPHRPGRSLRRMDAVPSNDEHQMDHLDTPNPSSISPAALQRHSVPETLFNHSDTTHNAASTIQSEDHHPRPSTSAPPDKSLFTFDDNSMELQDLKKSDDIASANSSHPGPTTLLVPTYAPDGHDEDGYMNSLPPPPPYDLKIEDLTIGVPTPASHLPIPLPSFLLKKASHEHGKTIVRNVSASCASGEMLAMYVRRLVALSPANIHFSLASAAREAERPLSSTLSLEGWPIFLSKAGTFLPDQLRQFPGY